jgi:hypothetical protein
MSLVRFKKNYFDENLNKHKHFILNKNQQRSVRRGKNQFMTCMRAY